MSGCVSNVANIAMSTVPYLECWRSVSEQNTVGTGQRLHFLLAYRLAIHTMPLYIATAVFQDTMDIRLSVSCAFKSSFGLCVRRIVAGSCRQCLQLDCGRKGGRVTLNKEHTPIKLSQLVDSTNFGGNCPGLKTLKYLPLVCLHAIRRHSEWSIRGYLCSRRIRDTRCSCGNKLASEYRRSRYSQTTIFAFTAHTIRGRPVYVTPKRITRFHLPRVLLFFFLIFRWYQRARSVFSRCCENWLQLEQLATFKLYLSSSHSVLLTPTQPVHGHPIRYKFTICFRFSVVIRHFICTCDLSTLHPTLANVCIYVYFVLLVITY
jgi:hypothetical protein